MKPLNWNPCKNTKLKQERGIGFETVRAALIIGAYSIRKLRSKNHPGQKGFIIRYPWKTWIVPYRENQESIFLHTIFEDK